MEKIFLCSAYRGDVEINRKKAVRIARLIWRCSAIPVVGHLYFPQFLDDSKPDERIAGIEMACELMALCDHMYIVGTKITKGMQYEIDYAKRLGIPVQLYDEEFTHIPSKTLSIDDRVDDAYRKAVEGLNFNWHWRNSK